MSDFLAGVRVIECATLMNGDYVGMMLGDLGADVIKVEDRQRGDYMRDILGQIGPRNSPAHLHLNRNKRSIALDLRDPEDQKVFWKLHESADIFVDGSVAGAAERRGIGYEAQRVRNPGIIYCQATGFGATGPYAQIPTHGRMQTALGGAYPMTKGNDGRVVQVVPEPSAYGTTKGAGYAASPSIAGAYAVAYIASALYALNEIRSGLLPRCWRK